MFKEKMKELRKLIADKEALTASMGSELRSLLEAEKLDEAKAKRTPGEQRRANSSILPSP